VSGKFCKRRWDGWSFSVTRSTRRCRLPLRVSNEFAALGARVQPGKTPMRIRRIMISAALAAGFAALPLSIAKAQYSPDHRQPTAKRTTDQLNREELTRLQSGNGYPPYYWASGSPSGWGSGYPWGWGSAYPWGWGWGYPACSSPFPLFWPFCVAGAVVGTAAMIVTAPFRAVPVASPYYYPPPYYYGPR
jgi:hypothetical protein